MIHIKNMLNLITEIRYAIIESKLKRDIRGT
jgi:hypothetical protein